MIDEVDDAQNAIDLYNLAAAKRVAGICRRASNGTCFHCGEKVRKPRRWCNAECRDAWEAEQ